jgi:hypothetical protein
MKKLLVILLSLPCFGIGQTRFDSGEDLSYLMGTKKVSYEIRWDSATFNGNESEKAFCEAKVKEKNFAKPGDGELWLEKWNESKAQVFPKYFLKFYEPRMKKSKLGVKENDPKALYHMIIYVLDIDPGNATIVSFNSRDKVNNSAKTNFRTLIVENNNRSVVKSNIYSHKIQGMEGMSPYDMDKTDTGRIKNCFFMYGYILADQLVIFNKKNKK